MSSPPEQPTNVEPLRIRHVASIAGAVTDAVSKRRIAGAVAKITDGPPEWKAKLAAASANPDYSKRPNRLDHAVSQSDGVFYFSDLPSGTYRLKVSVPELGTRLGV